MKENRECSSSSGLPLERIYTPENVTGIDYEKGLGDAGSFPFTRGIHREMYRSKLFTMRTNAGFGSGKDTNDALSFY